ncbi:hypothetical protein [Mobilicoccus pelagius]|uniref:Uncharacterized protein n=1 Tax=Mobilicoccus pelagius NBRC 104925 TaxID=1089455 RepID=H5US08_9MICO|nr:hypothetical protein [Mobilicoccus pelagius]GAB48516.1 hypothetical protein MOPEL_074_00030 [Mobilicoccus pelagius NBRC 104925]
MEVWTLHHPQQGVIELEQGFDAEFVGRYPDWPVPDSDTDENGAPKSGVRAGIDAGPRERVERWVRNPPLRLQVTVDGRVVGRYSGTADGDLPLMGRRGITKLASVGSALSRSKPHLRIRANTFDDLLEVYYRDADSIIEVDPPAGSRGAKRREAMASSDVKRVAYPFLAGLGKAGWAIAIFVLGPIIGRLLPHWDVDLPDVPWPDLPPLPQIHLPVPGFPRIHLPVPHLDLPPLPDLPDLPPLPPWLVTVLEHDQFWKPVLIGLVLGVIGLRNHRRSEAEKARWAQTHPDGADAETTTDEGRAAAGDDAGVAGKPATADDVHPGAEPDVPDEADRIP